MTAGRTASSMAVGSRRLITADREDAMELLTMVTWLIVAGISIPLGRGVVLGRLSLGLQALAGLGGVGLIILYVILEGPAGLAWGATGLAILGVLAVAIAAVGLTSDGGPARTPAGQALEESLAGWAGVQLPLFVLVAILSTATALNGAATF
jgi:hypothetical protein